MSSAPTFTAPSHLKQAETMLHVKSITNDDHSSSDHSSSSMSTMSSRTPNYHPLHSPNLPEEQLQAYFNAPSSPTHPNSLVPVSQHDSRLVTLLAQRPSMQLVKLLIRSAENVIRISHESAPTALPSPPITPVKGTFDSQQQQTSNQAQLASQHPKWKPLDQFILSVIQTSNAKVGTLVVTLVYLHRLRSKLPSMARGMPCTRHRVFLAALVVAAKYLNDSTPKNKHWAMYARVFETAEINLMEMQMLRLLEFDLRLTEDELIRHVQPMFRDTRQDAVKKAASATAARQARDTSPQMPVTPLSPLTPPRESNAPLRTRKTQPASIPPQELRQRESDRVAETQSNFRLKPVPVSARKVNAPSQMLAVDVHALVTFTPAHSAPSSSAPSPASLAPPMALSRNNDSSGSSDAYSSSGSSAVASSTVSSVQMPSPERRASFAGEYMSVHGLSSPVKEKHSYRASGMSRPMSYGNESLSGDLPPSASLPAIGKLGRWILPRRGRKGSS